MLRLKLISIILAAVIGASTVGVKAANGQKIEQRYEQAEQYLQDGKVEEAKLTFEEIITMDEEQGKAYIGLASILKDQGQLAEAEELLKSVFELVDDPNQVFASLEPILSSQEKYEEVEKYEELLAKLEENGLGIPKSLGDIERMVKDTIDEIDSMININFGSTQ